MSDTFITPGLDRLIDEIEDAGGTWHLIGGSQIVGPYLAFQLPPRDRMTEAVRQAMEDFQQMFASSEDCRRDVIDLAMEIGAYYVELFNDRPVVGDGRTIQ